MEPLLMVIGVVCGVLGVTILVTLPLGIWLGRNLSKGSE